jgi:hypothetical protein
MDRHLVFEGCDRTGKSSVIRALQHVVSPVKVSKMRVPRTKAESAEFYFDHFRQLGRAGHCTIWDRGHVSELVYGHLYKEYPTGRYFDLLRNAPFHLETVLPVTIVYCYPLSYDLMEPDEREGANLAAELVRYDQELRFIEMAMPKRWTVYRLCTHEWTSPGCRWRSTESMVHELVARLSWDR